MKSMTLKALPVRTAIVVSKVGAVKLASPVYGSAYVKADGVELVLAADVDPKTGEVRAKRLKERTPEVRAEWTLPGDTKVTAEVAAGGLPEGTVGAHWCKQTDRHAEGSEWHNGDVPLSPEGWAHRFVRGDRVTTAFCPVCTKKHSKDQAARTKAAEEQAKVDVSRVAEAAA